MTEHLNDTLILRGTWFGAPNTPHGGKIRLREDLSYPLEHLSALADNLKSILEFWKSRPSIGGVLLSVHYRELVAKSNRVCVLLAQSNSQKSVRGARFALKNERPNNHVITHFVQAQEVEKSISQLELVFSTLSSSGIKTVDQSLFERIEKGSLRISGVKVLPLLKDAAFVDFIAVDVCDPDETEAPFLMSFYKTGVPLDKMLSDIGITVAPDSYLDSNTILLSPTDKRKLFAKAPYLVAMAVTNLVEIPAMAPLAAEPSAAIDIPAPKGDEPIVGVIDTLCSNSAYFAKWVDIHNTPIAATPPQAQDYIHGSAVTSIIVDGPRANPWLDDGCGHMRVRHFGLATTGTVSRFDLLKKIREIVGDNPDIHVWNLSLGSPAETPANRISPEAAFLDQLQTEFNVTFVVAATNGDPQKQQRIGAPADTINGISVGACNRSNAPTGYTRHGPALHFFVKPDVACFGGEGADAIHVWYPPAGGTRIGTSFAAPWISRKMAYLINKLKLSRETAKALLIDSAIGWAEYPKAQWEQIGHGCVPIRIQDILHTPADEIRFVLHATTKNYRTCLYNIPVPMTADGGFNFHARATVCYFPPCSREQGVDYTLTELDARFGRIKFGQNGKEEIQDIRIPAANDPRFAFLKEGTARQMFQKWSNVKVLYKKIKLPNKGFSPNWGIRLDMADRLGSYSKRGMPFSIVVTLKEAAGANEIHRFKQACMARGWIVETLDIDQRVQIQEQAQEDVIFE